jgi:hypothetical protein
MLSLAERDFVLAAKGVGGSPWRVVLQHMLPDSLGPVIVPVTFGIPIAIFAEAGLGFTGFGLPPPTASLGRLVADGDGVIDRWDNCPSTSNPSQLDRDRDGARDLAKVLLYMGRTCRPHHGRLVR